MFERIMGIITLKAPTYKTVAEDPNATKQAMIIVLLMALINAIVAVAIQGYGIVGAVIAFIVALVRWYVAAWLLAIIAKAFGGKTDTNEMLRMTGYVAVFDLLMVFGLLGLVSTALACVTGILVFVVLILKLIGYVIGIREAAEFSTGNAVVTALIVTVISWVIGWIGTLLSNMV